MFISRLIKQKGIEEYLKAAVYFKNRSVGTEFHILGAPEKDYEQKVKVLKEQGTVIYHGRQEDVRPYISKCHCLIHPSFYPEGMSNVILESAATGRPVITTRRPGCQDGVEENVTGFLISSQSTSELIEAIKKFIGLSYREKVKMGIQARKKMEREFDRRIVVKVYMETINKILKRNA